MGLDIVEMVMEVEKAFAVRIPDADAARLETVGQLFAYLQEHAPLARQPDAWERFQTVLAHEIGVPRGEIRPEASFVRDLRMD